MWCYSRAGGGWWYRVRGCTGVEWFDDLWWGWLLLIFTYTYHFVVMIQPLKDGSKIYFFWGPLVVLVVLIVFEKFSHTWTTPLQLSPYQNGSSRVFSVIRPLHKWDWKAICDRVDSFRVVYWSMDGRGEKHAVREWDGFLGMNWIFRVGGCCAVLLGGLPDQETNSTPIYVPSRGRDATPEKKTKNYSHTQHVFDGLSRRFSVFGKKFNSISITLQPYQTPYQNGSNRSNRSTNETERLS